MMLVKSSAPVTFDAIIAFFEERSYSIKVSFDESDPDSVRIIASRMRLGPGQNGSWLFDIHLKRGRASMMVRVRNRYGRNSEGNRLTYRDMSSLMDVLSEWA